LEASKPRASQIDPMAFALRSSMASVPTLLIFMTAVRADDCDDGVCPVVQLQTRTTLSTPNETDWAALGGVCLNDLSDEMLAQPITEVLRTYPDEDGWCLYGEHDPFLSACAVCRKQHTMRPFVEVYKQQTAEVSKESPAKTLRFPDGSLLTLRDHVSPITDMYCYWHGYYNMPRERLVYDYDYLEKVSEASCRTLDTGYENMSWTDVHNLWDAEAPVLSGMMSETGISNVSQVFVENLQKHLAVKCLLGRGQGAICDISECAWRGCVHRDLESQATVVRYASLRECPEL